MHKGRWSTKCAAFNTFFKDVINNCYPIESVLSIGIRPGQEANRWNRTLQKLLPSIQYFENLEIDEKSVKKAKKSGNQFLNAQLGDVRNIDKIYSENSFDLIFWNQGPEHIKREEWEETFKKLEVVATKVLYLHCPWGKGYDKDTGHLSKSVRKGEFEVFGFKELVHGVEDTRDGGIISYKLV